MAHSAFHDAPQGISTPAARQKPHGKLLIFTGSVLAPCIMTELIWVDSIAYISQGLPQRFSVKPGVENPLEQESDKTVGVSRDEPRPTLQRPTPGCRS